MQLKTKTRWLEPSSPGRRVSTLSTPSQQYRTRLFFKLNGQNRFSDLKARLHKDNGSTRQTRGANTVS